MELQEYDEIVSKKLEFEDKIDQIILQQKKAHSQLEKINKLSDNELKEKIDQLNENNEQIRLENLLFARYLLRINSPKILENFDEYEETDNIISETLEQAELPDFQRRYSFKKVSNNLQRRKSTWTKMSFNWHENTYAPFMLRINQERLSIADYEVEQTRLDYLRMKENAIAKLDKLEITYRSIESDELAQEVLNRQLEHSVNKYRNQIGDGEFYSSSLTVPAELFISRINKRINSHTTTIGLIRLSSARLHMRIDEINAKMRLLDDLNDNLDDADVSVINTNHLHTTETYENVDRKYKIVKSSRFKLFYRLQNLKDALNKQETILNDFNKKIHALKLIYKQTVNEINSIKQECQMIFNENCALKDSMNTVIQVPTILDYVQVIKRNKDLKSDMNTWAKRVDITEIFLPRVKHETKTIKKLPSIQTILANDDSSIYSSNE